MKTLIYIIVALAIIAGGFFAYSSYIENQKVALVEKKLKELSKYDSRIDNFDVFGDIIEGECSQQNGFGAWISKDFRAKVEIGYMGSGSLVALLINEGKDGEQIYETRPEALEARKLLKDYKEIPSIVRKLEEVGEHDKAQDLLKMRQDIAKKLPQLNEKIQL